jgi:cholesterol transport system auxiliary component
MKEIPQTTAHSRLQTKTIQIQLPKSTKEIRGKKIWYAKNPLERNSYLYSRWSDTPNRLIARYLQNYLNYTHTYKAVIDENSLAKPDYILESNLEDFYQLFENEKNAYGILKMHFFLIDAQNEKIIDTFSVNLKIPSPSPDAKGGVEALHTATRRSAETLLQWLQNSRK